MHPLYFPYCRLKRKLSISSISYREHGDFHEQCVEKIYMDLWERCKPESLNVYARYVRRGGLDINPFRSSEMDDIDNLRLSRQ